MCGAHNVANTVHMVPEKYRKTRFTASCWFYLAKNARLTFKEYQREAKDRVCREDVFDQVKKDMELDRLFKKEEAVYPPDPEEKAPPPPPPPPPPPRPPANPVISQALAAGLGQSGEQVSTAPVTPERRLSAEAWVRERVAQGFAAFKLAHPEKELDKAWFDAARRKQASTPPKEIPMAKQSPGSGPPAGADLVKLRAYLKTLSPENLINLTHKQYVKKSGHSSMKASQFNTEKFRQKRTLQGLPQVKHRKSNKGSASTPPAGNTVRILADIPLSKYDGKIPPAVLKEVVLDVVKQILGGETIKVVHLTDPPSLEVRI